MGSVLSTFDAEYNRNFSYRTPSAMPVKKKIKKVDEIGARKGKINQLINRFSSGGNGDGKGTLASQEIESDGL